MLFALTPLLAGEPPPSGRELRLLMAILDIKWVRVRVS